MPLFDRKTSEAQTTLPVPPAQGNGPRSLLRIWLLRTPVQYGALFGATVAILTDRINTEDFGFQTLSPSDSGILYCYLFILYGALGLAVAFAGSAAHYLLDRLRFASAGLALHFGCLWLVPALVILMLPDVAVLSPYPYEYFWHALGPPGQAAIAAVAAALLTSAARIFIPGRLLRASAFYSARTANPAVFFCGLFAVLLGNSLISLQQPAPSGEDPAPAFVGGSAYPVAVIGIDGLGRDPIVRAGPGKLPRLTRLIESECSFEMDGSFPGVTPKKWPVITTGRPSRDTGVYFYMRYRLPGIQGEIQRWPLETFTSLTSLLLLDAYIDVAQPLGCEEHLQAEPVWRMFEKQGMSTSTVCWPNSWPCSEKSGTHRSSCPRSGKSAMEKIDAIASEAVNAISAGSELVMVYFNHLDVASHHYCGYAQSSHLLDEILVGLDRAVGRVIDALPDGGALLLVSDHGFDYRICTHVLGIPGVAVAWKKNSNLVCSHEADPLPLRSVAPTIINLLADRSSAAD